MFGETIAAVSTPRGKGGVALIRISGDEALSCLEKIFQPMYNGGFPERKAVYGKIVMRGEIVDTGLATYFAEGHSYTGEPTAEITCHGGIAVTAAVLEAALWAGARLAEAGEFTRRAFVNGRLTLTEAEAVGRLIDADTESRRKLAASAAGGSLARKTGEIRDSLVGVLAALYAAIDYPDEDIGDEGETTLLPTIEKGAAEVKSLLSTYKTGHAVADGVKTVICGAPNSGKSSLYNRLCGAEKAIVTSIAGTTRDTLEETVDAGGITLRLADTAGLREADDEVEKVGIDRARDKMAEAELIIFVCDGSRPLTDEEKELIYEIKELEAAKIAVINKKDLGTSDSFIPENIFDKTVRMSAMTGEGTDALTDAIAELWGSEKISLSSDAVIWNARQKASLESSLDLLTAAADALRLGAPADAACTMVESALSSMGELDGRGVCEDIVSQVFARFCVGK